MTRLAKTSVLSRIFGGGREDLKSLDRRLLKMLAVVESMYKDAIDSVLLDNQDLKQVEIRVRDKDRELNEYEEEIRRDILTSISNKSRPQDMGWSLNLLSFTKDAERMGDYIKNIYNVRLKKETVFKDEYKPAFVKQRDWAVTAFPRLIKALQNQDMKVAKEICDETHEMSKKASQVVDQLIKDPRRSETPVATSLMFLFHKRMLRHMFNIARKMISPYDRLEDYDQGLFNT